MKPSFIKYWKNGYWITTKRIFTTEDEIRDWYKANRSRIDGLTVVIPVVPEDQKTLVLSPIRVVEI